MASSTEPDFDAADASLSGAYPGSTEWSRRKFLGTAAGAAAGAATLGITGGLTGWIPAFRIPAAGAATPPSFPSTISLYQQAYKNWAGDIAVDAAWTCAPKTPADVVAVGMPYFHVGGAICLALGSMVFGQTLIIVSPDGYRDSCVIGGFWDLVEAHGVTAAGSAPTFGERPVCAPVETTRGPPSAISASPAAIACS